MPKTKSWLEGLGLVAGSHRCPMDCKKREGGQVQLKSHRIGEKAIVAREPNPNTSCNTVQETSCSGGNCLSVLSTMLSIPSKSSVVYQLNACNILNPLML